MGNAAPRSLERVAAARGVLESAPIEFQATCDVAQGGVLLALPALLAAGMLRPAPEVYQMPNRFFCPHSRFLLLAWMALASTPSLKQNPYHTPGPGGETRGIARRSETSN